MSQQYRNSTSTLLLLELSSFLLEFADKAAVFLNALEQASLLDENDLFADLREPDVFLKEHNETRCVQRLASNL